VFDFKDSRLSLYTGKNAIAVAQQQTLAEGSDTDNANATLSNPLALYLQRQPTLRVQVSCAPFMLLQSRLQAA
jgi:hypothetical protein